jgi:hypothetical protein
MERHARLAPQTESDLEREQCGKEVAYRVYRYQHDKSND